MNYRKINDIVDANYVHASVLYYFGIAFYDYSDKTLEQACNERGLDIDSVVRKLESVNTTITDNKLLLNAYPVELIIAYLKHAHYIFIKEKLPYLARLIQNVQIGNASDYSHIIKDLKFIFPIFVEDFIHHIYEEEDTLFSHILILDKFLKGQGGMSEAYFQMEKHSLQRYAVEHSEHDDEMKGIRNISNNYTIADGAPLHVRVIYAELKSLEHSLITHAKVENEILFPKALMLEKEAKHIIQSKVQFN